VLSEGEVISKSFFYRLKEGREERKEKARTDQIVFPFHGSTAYSRLALCFAAVLFQVAPVAVAGDVNGVVPRDVVALFV